MTILDTAAKPYPKDYRQSPYYKSSFYLKLYHIFKKWVFFDCFLVKRVIDYLAFEILGVVFNCLFFCLNECCI